MESPGAGVLVWVDRFQLPLACLASAVVCFIMGAVVGGKFWALAFSAMLLTALVSGVVIAIRVATATAAPVVELSTVPVSDDVRSRVGGHEKLPAGGHENAHPRPIRTAHRRTRKCPLAVMNLPRPL